MMKRTTLCATVFGAFGGLALLGLAGCDNNPAATPARMEAATAPPPSALVRQPSYSEPASETRESRRTTEASDRAPAPLFRGKPMWADNRNHTAEENAKYQFDQHGDELGAKTLDEFLTKSHAFVGKPPSGVLTKTRSNGDTLMYDPASGLFAVARSDGAPRTVFKPNDGEAYWKAQDTGSSRTARTRRSTATDDEG